MTSYVSMKLVVVGDGAVGKTCLLTRYHDNRFPEDYIPTVFDNYCTLHNYNSERVSVSTCDTAGAEDYDRLRPLAYISADIVLICFSVSRPASLKQVLDKWIGDVRNHLPDTPVMVVGLKSDLKKDPELVQRLKEQGITLTETSEGERVAKQAMAYAYMECSAKHGTNVKEVFTTAVKCVMERRNPTPSSVQAKKCTMM